MKSRGLSMDDIGQMKTKPIAKPYAIIIEDNEDKNLVLTTAMKQAGYYKE